MMAGILNVGNRDLALRGKFTGQSVIFSSFMRGASLSLRAVFSLEASGNPPGGDGYVGALCCQWLLVFSSVRSISSLAKCFPRKGAWCACYNGWDERLPRILL